MVNLDPANDNLEFSTGEGSAGDTLTVDVRDLITLDDVMEEYKLGPNGGMIYCAEFLEANFQWLSDELNKKFLQHKC